jgi:hypothetical protein
MNILHNARLLMGENSSYQCHERSQGKRESTLPNRATSRASLPPSLRTSSAIDARYWEGRAVWRSGSQALRLSGSQALRLSGSQALRLSDSPINAQPVQVAVAASPIETTVVDEIR